MPVIAAVNTKGGTGKSTTIAVLADRLARRGASTIILDADPQQRLMKWKHSRIQDGTSVDVIAAADEAKIVPLIDGYAASHQFVFVDLQGAGSLLIARAASRVHLALLPLSASGSEAEGAGEASAFLDMESQTLRRKIPTCLTFNRTRNITTTIEREIRSTIMEAGIPVLDVDLMDRQAYNAFIGKGISLEDQRKAQTNKAGKDLMDRVIENAEAFTQAFLVHLHNVVQQSAKAS